MNNTHPLEVLKFCPKCGSAEFHPEGERSLKCKNCSFHFYINSAAAVAALIPDSEGRLMLVTRGVEPDYGKLDLPGGFIDPGETPENALKRELREELGLKVKSMRYLGSAPNEYLFSGMTVFTLDLAFLVIPESLEELHPMDDILQYQFCREDDFDYKNIPAPSIRSFVQQFFQYE